MSEPTGRPTDDLFGAIYAELRDLVSDYRRGGHIDMRAQTEVPSALRTETPA